MKNNITTLKIKYTIENKDFNIILDYIKNYNNILRYTYNRVQEGITSTKELTKLQNNLSNIIVDSLFKHSAIYEAKSYQESNIIFGGKKLFLDRCKNKISKEEFLKQRLLPLYSIGESNQKGNRKFQILDDKNILFKPNRNVHINLKLSRLTKKYKNKILKLMPLQNYAQISISYKLDLKYIYISFDNSVIEKYVYNTINNRIIAIDMNPNYLGYSVVNWINENNYEILDKGVFDISEINKKENNLKVSSTDKKKKYIKNKRDFEISQIAHKLFDICKYYHCGYFVIEDLKINSKDIGRGKKLNKLINNQWNKNKFTNILRKLLNSSSTTLLEVPPQYSSILGNLVYREEHLPDMVLSSIELSRRGFEYSQQYLLNTKTHQKTIIFPNLELVKPRIIQSLEELNNPLQFGNYGELFSELKKSKIIYRFLLKDCKSLRVFRAFHYKSYVNLYSFM